MAFSCFLDSHYDLCHREPWVFFPGRGDLRAGTEIASSGKERPPRNDNLYS